MRLGGVLLRWRVHVEVSFRAFPVIADFVEHSADQAEEGVGVRKDAGDTGATLDFLVDKRFKDMIFFTPHPPTGGT